MSLEAGLPVRLLKLNQFKGSRISFPRSQFGMFFLLEALAIYSCVNVVSLHLVKPGPNAGVIYIPQKSRFYPGSE